MARKILSSADLLQAPSDLDLLNKLEENLTRAASAFIDEVVMRAFEIKGLSFDCSLSNQLARASIVDEATYKILFGRSLTSATLNLATLVAPQAREILDIFDEKEIIEFTFNYISWLILLHEVAHITHGHLEYIQEKGMAGYIEISTERVPLVHLHEEPEESQHFWRALESEADAYAISASLPTFYYINNAEQWKTLMTDTVIRYHGMMASLTFHMMHVLANGYQDFRHPPATIRLGISLASIESLAKSYGWSVDKTITLIIEGHYEMAAVVLAQEVDVHGPLESARYMSTLDATIKRASFENFRVKARVR